MTRVRRNWSSLDSLMSNGEVAVAGHVPPASRQSRPRNARRVIQWRMPSASVGCAASPRCRVREAGYGGKVHRCGHRQNEAPPDFEGRSCLDIVRESDTWFLNIFTEG